MTNDRDTREVFLGPTTQETDEFYAYQRDNPGKDKSEYLTWFEDKFGKEIELRRRRSDQPSDLEYMVIKKRSKYRERIGLESEKLLAYYEANPKKTYRELAAWFQKQFGKEIDITAISRMCASNDQIPPNSCPSYFGHDSNISCFALLGALKRNRNSADTGGESPPDSTGPPPAKRGRRSYGSANASASSAGGPPQSSMPTFSVDISNRPHPESEEHTPKSRPETPQIPADIAPFPDRMAQDGLKIESKPQNIQPAVYPARIRSAIPPESPSPLPPQAATHPQTPMWNPVNPSPSNFAAKGGKIAAKSERPSTVPPSSHKESQPQISPARPNPLPRVLRSNSVTKGSAPPIIPVVNGNVPPPSESPEFRGPHVQQRHPGDDEMNLEALRTRLTDVVTKKAQLHDEMRILEAEIANNEKVMALRQYDLEIRRFQEIEASFRQEHGRLQTEYDDLKAWNAEISRGNLQLQNIKAQLEADNQRLQDNNNTMAAEIQALSTKLAELREKMSKESNGTPTPNPGQSSVSAPDNRGSSSEKAELSSWLTAKFAKDAEKEEKLKRLVEDLNKAGWKDLEGRVQELVGFVNDMGAERQVQQAQWTAKLFPNGEAPVAAVNGGKTALVPFVSLA